MLILSALAGLIATMFTASVVASLVALRHEDVSGDPATKRYNRQVF